MPGTQRTTTHGSLRVLLLSYGTQRILRLFVDKILDVGAATLALADMVSDVFVTIQYWEDARSHGDYPIFFVVSCCILCGSYMASTCMLFLHIRSLHIRRIYGVLLISILPLCGLGLLLLVKPQALEPWLMFRLLFVSVVLPFFLLPLLKWRSLATKRNEKPDPKLPFKGVVSVARGELFADEGEPVLEVSEAKAAEASPSLEAGPYQVLMVTHTPTYENLEQKTLLKGSWIARERNAAPYKPEHITHRIDFGSLDLDEDKPELYIATDLTDVKTELDGGDEVDLVGGVVFQILEWLADEEAWHVASTVLDEKDFMHRWVLPRSARVRMLHPNAIEIYLSVGGEGGGEGGKVVIGYMFRESEYFEPVHDESLTLRKYHSWLGERRAEESALMVWLGTSDAPVAPPMLDVIAEGNDTTAALRQWTKYTEHLSFRSELSLYESSRQWIRIQTQMPFLVETVFESVPQSLLQTSAMVMYSMDPVYAKDVTIPQLMSVGISVTSLIAKVYLACDSMVPKMFFFKLACVSYDLVSLFFTVTALWAAKPEDEDAMEVFFLTRPVDWASAVYVWVLFIAFVTLWDGGLACIVMIYNRDLSNCNGLACVLWVGLIVIWSLIPIPLSILLMSIRLSWVVALIHYYEGTFRTNYSFYREIYEFVHGGADVDERISAVKDVLDNDTAKADPDSPRSDPGLPDVLHHNMSHKFGRSSTNAGSVYARARSSQALRHSFSTLDAVHARSEARRGKLVSALKWACCGMCCSPCLFPVVFPVAYSILYPHLAFYIAIHKWMTLGRRVNPFSLYLYGALVFFFLLSITLSPVAWRFLRFAWRVPHASKLMASEDEKVKEVRAVYAKRYEKTSHHKRRTTSGRAAWS